MVAIDTLPVRLRYQTLEVGEFDIHLRTLRDSQQFNDQGQVAENSGIPPASWALFGVVWDSSQVLAHLMLQTNVQGMRVLELGCGIALPSIVLSKLQADITATDLHPCAEDFLERNSSLNNGSPIPFVRTSWLDANSDLGRFDLIIGSDLLYEPDLVGQLSSFISRHSTPEGRVIIVDPGRSLHPRFSKEMVSQGYSLSKSKPDTSAYLAKPFKGTVLTYERGVMA